MNLKEYLMVVSMEECDEIQQNHCGLGLMTSIRKIK